jgi:hypothetical protein
MIRLPFPKVVDDRGAHHGARGGAMANGPVAGKERVSREAAKARRESISARSAIPTVCATAVRERYISRLPSSRLRGFA